MSKYFQYVVFNNLKFDVVSLDKKYNITIDKYPLMIPMAYLHNNQEYLSTDAIFLKRHLSAIIRDIITKTLEGDVRSSFASNTISFKNKVFFHLLSFVNFKKTFDVSGLSYDDCVKISDDDFITFKELCKTDRFVDDLAEYRQVVMEYIQDKAENAPDEQRTFYKIDFTLHTGLQVDNDKNQTIPLSCVTETQDQYDNLLRQTANVVLEHLSTAEVTKMIMAVNMHVRPTKSTLAAVEYFTDSVESLKRRIVSEDLNSSKGHEKLAPGIITIDHVTHLPTSKMSKVKETEWVKELQRSVADKNKKNIVSAIWDMYQPT